MQQLTLQFEGFAPIGQPKTHSTATQCNPVSEAAAHIKRAVISSALSRNLTSRGITARLKLYAQATVAVAFGFSLMFLSAIIGG